MEKNSTLQLTDDLILDMSRCVNTRREKYRKGEFIPILSGNRSEIGIILNGTISLMKSDIDGNWLHLTRFKKKELISKLWTYNEENDLFFVSNSETEILFIDTIFFTQSCNPLCARHNKLISYLFDRILKYTKTLNQTITILQKKNMQEKLLSYFKLVAKTTGSHKFELPMTYKELADYLAVDRSAMMRKINELQEKKYLTKKGKTIYLKQKSFSS